MGDHKDDDMEKDVFSELLVVKTMMESLAKRFQQIMEKLGNDPRYMSRLRAGHGAEGKLQKKLDRPTRSKSSKSATPFALMKKSAPLRLVSSPITTPQHNAGRPAGTKENERETTYSDCVVPDRYVRRKGAQDVNFLKKTGATLARIKGLTIATDDSRAGSSDIPEGLETGRDDEIPNKIQLKVGTEQASERGEERVTIPTESEESTPVGSNDRTKTEKPETDEGEEDKHVHSNSSMETGTEH